MQEAEEGALVELVANVYAFYRQDFSKFAAGVWVRAMQPFDFKAVTDAMNRHCVNPDSGQFAPKPADIVKMLSGTTQDAALVAWSKVDRAAREVGPYQSVVFDDPVIHRVLTDMGGWAPLGTKTEDEWPFVRNEFVNRYRGYRMRSEIPEYQAVLTGICDAQNQVEGFSRGLPVLVGDPDRAKIVMQDGSSKPLLSFTRAAELELPRLADVK